MPRLKRAAVVMLLAACARPGVPPGGVQRLTPPVLIGARPADSTCAVPGMKGDAEFRFDEVISEGSQPNFGYGTGDLERLVLFSPDTGVPVVGWHRDRITVHPRAGWRPNTVYRIELAPGVMDLWHNTSKGGATLRFTTGTTCPTHSLSGRAIDWSARRGVPQALIDAIHLPDSLTYRTIADSTGRFRLDRLPGGYYIVRATIDQNHDHRQQSSEAWDTVRAAPGVDTVGEIWTFARDTLPPKIQTVARLDSQAIAVTFTKPIDPGLRLDSTSIRVLLIISPTDSGTITPLAAFPKALYDSLYHVPPPRPAATDTGRKGADTTAADTTGGRKGAPPPAKAPPQGARGDTTAAKAKADLPVQKRPDLGSVLVIRTQGRVQDDKRYFVELSNVRSAGGITGPPVSTTFTTPKPQPADTTKQAKSDSGKVAKPDSGKVVKPDSGKVVRPDSGVTIKPGGAKGTKLDSLKAIRRNSVKPIKPDSGGTPKPDSTGPWRRRR